MVLLEDNIKKIVLNLLSEAECGDKLTRSEVNRVITYKFRMRKKLINLTLKELEKDGKVKFVNQFVILEPKL